MKTHEIEEWALRVIDRVERGQPVEDSRVELKSTWISHQDSARQIAAIANAARGENVLWLVGVDEDSGVTGVDNSEFGNWKSQVQAEFNEISPDFFLVQVPYKGKTVSAILVDTTRAPFLVRNFSHGTKGAGPVAFEVPWRDGNTTRTARRSDMIRILSPIQRTPSIEVQTGELVLNPSRLRTGIITEVVWDLHFALYIVPAGMQRIVIPYHYCEGSLEIPGILPQTQLERLSFLRSFGSRDDENASIRSTTSELILDGPGVIHVISNFRAAPPVEKSETEATCILKMKPIGCDIAAESSFQLLPSKDGQPDSGKRWVFNPDNAGWMRI